MLFARLAGQAGRRSILEGRQVVRLSSKSIGIFGAVAAVAFATLSVPVGGNLGTADAAPVAPVEVPIARAVNHKWVELHMPDPATPYDTDLVEDESLYSVVSDDDPNFASGLTPTVVERRHYPETAPYGDTSDGSENVANLDIAYR